MRVPPQVLVFVVSAICNPEGRLSVNARPCRAFAVLGLVMVNVRVVVTGLKVKTGIWVAPKALAIDGGNKTVMVVG